MSKFETNRILKASCFAMVAAMLAPTAAAEVTGNIDLTSDYRFRGVSQSAGKIALQGGIEYAADNGFFAGAWASTIDFDKGAPVEEHVNADLELDLYLGYAGSLSDSLDYDVTFYRYNYPGDDVSQDYNEISIGLEFADIRLAYWYANDYGNSGDDLSYTEANYSYALSDDWSLDLHAGYNFGDAIEDYEYVDYSIGLSTEVSGIEVSIAWLGSDIASEEIVNKDAWKSKDTLLLSASYSF